MFRDGCKELLLLNLSCAMRKPTPSYRSRFRICGCVAGSLSLIVGPLELLIENHHHRPAQSWYDFDRNNLKLFLAKFNRQV